MRRSGQSEFSLLLRSARLRSGILQIDIKSHIGIPQCKISNYECDKQLPCRPQSQQAYGSIRGYHRKNAGNLWRNGAGKCHS